MFPIKLAKQLYNIHNNFSSFAWYNWSKNTYSENENIKAQWMIGYSTALNFNISCTFFQSFLFNILVTSKFTQVAYFATALLQLDNTDEILQ